MWVRPTPFMLSPPKQEFPNNIPPAPLTGGPEGVAGTGAYAYFSAALPICAADFPLAPTAACIESIAQTTETGLPADSAPDSADADNLTYYQSLVTGGTGQKSKVPDQRIANVLDLAAGPFQLTGPTLPYVDYAASPVHRFYQMWQQLNCNLREASWQNPSGCNGALFSWVEVTVGAGTDGVTQPSNFSTEYSASAKTTGEGSTALGFYNVQQGDAPYFTYLANNYAMSDNFHQSVNGGTGANHIMLGHGDAIWFSVANPRNPAQNLPAPPPENFTYNTTPAGANGSTYGGVVNEIENPNPARGTNNWYTEDGYGTDFNEGFAPSDWETVAQNGGPLIYGGGSYSNCDDPSQPGVRPIREYLVHGAAHRSALRARALLPAEQLQPGLLRQRQQRLHRPQPLKHAVYHPAFHGAEHRRHDDQRQHFLEVLRRPVERLRARSV